MKTKIVYVLVSQENDYYYEMLLLSHYSLRLYHPKGDAEVVLVMDTDTHQRLVNKKAPILDDVTCIVVEVPLEYTVMQRSRYLKTTLRLRVKGDFLYIDTDTIICEALNEIDEFTCDIGAILDNHHGDINDWQVWNSPEKLNWKYLAKTKHLNGGVLYVKDTNNASLFFDQWHKNWAYAVSFGCNYDQISLRKTLIDTNINVDELEGIWNCQVIHESSLIYRERAKIIHYQDSSIQSSFLITTEASFLKIRMSGTIPSEITSLVNHPRKYFSNQIRMINVKEQAYLRSPMYNVFLDYPHYFSFLVSISHKYRYLMSISYRIKQKIRRLFFL